MLLTLRIASMIITCVIVTYLLRAALTYFGVLK